MNERARERGKEGAPGRGARSYIKWNLGVRRWRKNDLNGGVRVEGGMECQEPRVKSEECEK